MIEWMDGVYETHKHIFVEALRHWFGPGVTIDNVYCDAAGEGIYSVTIDDKTIRLYALWDSLDVPETFYARLAERVFRSFHLNTSQDTAPTSSLIL